MSPGRRHRRRPLASSTGSCRLPCTWKCWTEARLSSRFQPLIHKDTNLAPQERNQEAFTAGASERGDVKATDERPSYQNADTSPLASGLA